MKSIAKTFLKTVKEETKMKRKLFLLLAACWGLFYFMPTMAMAEWTPLPKDINIIKPGDDVPPELRVFSGVWEGSFPNVRPNTARNLTVVVEKVELTKATVVWSWGPKTGSAAGYTRIIGRVEETSIILEMKTNKVKLSIVEKELRAVWTGETGTMIEGVLFKK
jgi:hypothetical protein